MANVWSNEHYAVALYELRRLGLGMADKIEGLAPGATGGDGVPGTRVASTTRAPPPPGTATTASTEPQVGVQRAICSRRVPVGMGRLSRAHGT